MSARVAVEALDRLEQRLKDTRHTAAAVFRGKGDDGFKAGFIDGYDKAMDAALHMVRDLLDDYDRPRGGAR